MSFRACAGLACALLFLAVASPAQGQLTGPPWINSMTATASQSMAPADVSLSVQAGPLTGSRTVSQVHFFVNGQNIGVDYDSPYVWYTNVSAAGTYNFHAVAYNAYGEAVSNTATVTLAAPNQLPTASVSQPATNAAYVSPANIAIAANAWDPDGSIAQVQFFGNGAFLGTDTT